MKGRPELVIELRSPSNRRTKERLKRQNYFQNGTLVVWDVAPEKRKIWVYEAENPLKATEYGEDDTITCERLFPGWKRLVADFFSKELTAEQIVGDTAKEWRAESEAKGRAEGEAKGRAEGEAKGRAEGMLEALRMMLSHQARHRFEAEKLPNDLEARLERYTIEQLTVLAGSLAISSTLEEWLANFPN
jgi:flagellar biosynthesis/type III secretory pathway protein FliH